ncbi:unnamed protein product, partial [marine sediment metagenome]
FSSSEYDENKVIEDILKDGKAADNFQVTFDRISKQRAKILAKINQQIGHYGLKRKADFGWEKSTDIVLSKDREGALSSKMDGNARENFIKFCSNYRDQTFRLSILKNLIDNQQVIFKVNKREKLSELWFPLGYAILCDAGLLITSTIGLFN